MNKYVTLWDGFRYTIRNGVVYGQVNRDSARMGIVDDAAIIAEVKRRLA